VCSLFSNLVVAGSGLLWYNVFILIFQFALGPPPGLFFKRMDTSGIGEEKTIKRTAFIK